MCAYNYVCQVYAYICRDPLPSTHPPRLQHGAVKMCLPMHFCRGTRAVLQTQPHPLPSFPLSLFSPPSSLYFCPFIIPDSPLPLPPSPLPPPLPSPLSHHTLPHPSGSLSKGRKRVTERASLSSPSLFLSLSLLHRPQPPLTESTYFIFLISNSTHSHPSLSPSVPYRNR